MPWQTSLIERPLIVHTTYQGQMTIAEIEAACRATIEIGDAAGTHHYLTDCRDLSGSLAVADLFYLIDFLFEVGIDQVRAREAVLASAAPDIAEKMEFWENAMVNRGFNCRRFTDIDSAMAWLGA